MALKIKEGSVISAYGPSCKSFDSTTVLSQTSLAQLQARFPDDIVDDAPPAAGSKEAKAAAILAAAAAEDLNPTPTI